MNEVTYAFEVGRRRSILQCDDEAREFTGRLLITVDPSLSTLMRVEAEVELVRKNSAEKIEMLRYGERLFSIRSPNDDCSPVENFIRREMLLLSRNEYSGASVFGVIDGILLWHLRANEGDRRELATYAPGFASRGDGPTT